MNNSNFKSKGFVFILEAIIALVIFALILSSFTSPSSNYSLKELAIIQQSNDLLRVWSAKETNTSEMITDTKLLFKEKATLKINQNIVLKGNEGKNCYTTLGEIITNTLNSNNIEITVCE